MDYNSDTFPFWFISVPLSYQPPLTAPPPLIYIMISYHYLSSPDGAGIVNKSHSRCMRTFTGLNLPIFIALWLMDDLSPVTALCHYYLSPLCVIITCHRSVCHYYLSPMCVIITCPGSVCHYYLSPLCVIITCHSHRSLLPVIAMCHYYLSVIISCHSDDVSLSPVATMSHYHMSSIWIIITCHHRVLLSFVMATCYYLSPSPVTFTCHEYLSSSSVTNIYYHQLSPSSVTNICHLHLTASVTKICHHHLSATSITIICY